MTEKERIADLERGLERIVHIATGSSPPEIVAEFACRVARETLLGHPLTPPKQQEEAK